MDKNNSTQKPFHKTKPGKIFLGVLFVLLLIGLAFGGLIAYYTYTLKYGSKKQKQQLAQRFGETKTSQTQGKNQTLQTKIKRQKVNQIIRNDDPKFGEGDLTIVAFMDFECPFCQKQYSTLRKVMDKYKPEINLVFKHFPLKSIHPNAMKASIAATCAQEQDKFWSYFDRLYQQQEFNQQAYLSYATSLGLDQQKFQQCLNQERYKQRIQQDLKDGIQLKVRGTPTFIIDNKKKSGVLSKKQWNDLILEQIQASAN